MPENKLSITALVSDWEFLHLQLLRDSMNVYRVRHPDAIRAFYLSGKSVGAFVGRPLIDHPEFERQVSHFTASFPLHPVVGILGTYSDTERVTAACAMGRAGVRSVVDISGNLKGARSAFDSLVDPFLSRAVAEITADIGSPTFRRFIAECFLPEITTSCELFTRLRVVPSTGMSRFLRAGLPSPKQYIAWATFAHAAHLAENPGVTLPTIADRVCASSPQSFGRTVKAFTGMTASDFRRRYTGDAMIALYREQLIVPYLETLRTFNPLRDRVGEPAGREELQRLSA